MKCYECKWLDRSVILTSSPPQYGCTLGFGSHYADHECEYDFMPIVRCKDCRHGEHIQIPLWENRDIDKAPSQFHDFIKCHKFHIKGFNETLYLGDDDYCSHGERKE